MCQGYRPQCNLLQFHRSYRLGLNGLPTDTTFSGFHPSRMDVVAEAAVASAAATSQDLGIDEAQRRVINTNHSENIEVSQI